MKSIYCWSSNRQDIIDCNMRTRERELSPIKNDFELATFCLKQWGTILKYDYFKKQWKLFDNVTANGEYTAVSQSYMLWSVYEVIASYIGDDIRNYWGDNYNHEMVRHCRDIVLLCEWLSEQDQIVNRYKYDKM